MPAPQPDTKPANAPADHPKLPRRRVGILLANLGTPDATSYWPMRRYLSEFLSDKRVIDYPAWKWQPILQGIILSIRPFKSGKNYASIWNNEKNESPLMTITRAQCVKFAQRAKAAFGDDVMVDFAMRYGKPNIRTVAKSMQAAGCDRILFFPLYPQYAAPTTATANDQMFRALMDMNWQPALRTVPAYFEDGAYLDALTASVKKAYDALQNRPKKLVVSYHGVPERYLLAGDPYHCQCQKTTRLLAERLGWDAGDLITSFQSKFGPEKWVGPATVELVADLAKQGVDDIAVVSPAFASDCIETLEEIQGEIAEAFEEAGGKTFTYIPCLNEGDDHMDALFGIARRELAGWL
ncbi:MAG: ferrochelatase [Paracoccaceae bacterium]